MKSVAPVSVLLLAVLSWATAGAEANSLSCADRCSLTGKIETIQSLRVRSPHDTITSRAGLQLKLAADLEWLYGFVSLDGEKNWIVEDETGVDLDEAWVEHVGNGWDLRVGRQIIIWGQADGIQITDIISPPDYTESITRDLEDIRQPVEAAQFRLTGDQVDVAMIWIPVFKAAIQPEGDNPWAIQNDLPDGVTASMADPLEPDAALENGEIAAKVSAYMQGLDVSASAFYTWDDHPAYHRQVHMNGGTVHIAYTPEHHRLTVLGLTLSRPWSDFVFRGEAAYYLGRYLEPARVKANPIRRDILIWLGGLDWSPGGNWSVIAQFSGEHVLDHDTRLADDAHTYLATLNVSKKLLRETLTLSNIVFYHLNDNECYDRMAVEYAATDAFRFSLGADVFIGADGRFGQYQDNTQVWMKAKYSF
jgi:hypothetical protein